MNSAEMRFESIRIDRMLISVLVGIFLCVHLSADAQEKTYRIGANDVLHLVIYAGGEKQHESDLTVSPQGMINAPFIGIVKARRLTVGQLQKEVVNLLSKDYFVNPEVDIYIKEYHSLQYYISGAVTQPGLYKATSEMSLLELIAKAGGTLPERGKLAYIMRNEPEETGTNGEKSGPLTSKEPIKVNLQQLLDKGDLSANIPLNPGDVVYLPMQISMNIAESKVYVEGEVKNPGIYNYQLGMTAMNACILSGGFTKFAAPNRAKIIRQKEDQVEVIKINLDRVQSGKAKDIELIPGDRIHIPETWI